MKKTENEKLLISMLDEILYDLEITGGVMLDTREKARQLINSLNPVEPEPFTGIKGDENICKRCNNEIWVEIEDGFWDFQCQCNILTYMK